MGRPTSGRKRKYYEIAVKKNQDIALGKSSISEKLQNYDKIGPLGSLWKNWVGDFDEIHRLLNQEMSVSAELWMGEIFLIGRANSIKPPPGSKVRSKLNNISRTSELEGVNALNVDIWGRSRLNCLGNWGMRLKALFANIMVVGKVLVFALLQRNWDRRRRIGFIRFARFHFLVTYRTLLR